MNDLMTITDLAARWGVTLPQAKRHVRANGVPFIAIGSADLNINWRTTRFRLADVIQWEQDAARVFEPRNDDHQPKAAVAKGTTYKFIKM